MPQAFPLAPAIVSSHRAFSSNVVSRHDYTNHDKMLTRLAHAQWSSNSLLHCVRTSEI
jgi:hypothetical protein